MPKLASLEYAIHEAIWMHLEGLMKCPQKLVDDLHELANGGPRLRAGPEAQNLHHSIKSLVGDVDSAIDEYEANIIPYRFDDEEPHEDSPCLPDPWWANP